MMVSMLERFLPSTRDTAKAVVVERRDEALVIARNGVEERIALSEIRQGWIEDVCGEGDACDVLLRLRNGRDVAVRVTSRAEGESLLRAARLRGRSRPPRPPAQPRVEPALRRADGRRQRGAAPALPVLRRRRGLFGSPIAAGYGVRAGQLMLGLLSID